MERRALVLHPAGAASQRHWRKWSGRSPGHAGRRPHLGLSRLPSKASALARGATLDYRPIACLILVAIVLTLHEYYGGRNFYESSIKPVLAEYAAEPGREWLQFAKFDELLGYTWWVLARVGGYLLPLPLWKILFPKDSLLDMGLRTKGFMQHIWIYIACLSIVVAAMLVMATQPDFLNYYPFYKQSSRSWLDFLLWQGMYWMQFFALELFFRGWMLAALRRTMGMGAIFVMVVPYCMIHFGKPYLEAHAAIVAGVVLGSLAMRTRSIYAGFLVHITVATLMDTMALASRDALPTTFWPSP
jgi:membrane protease YdiL (CAAX protease family)